MSSWTTSPQDAVPGHTQPTRLSVPAGPATTRAATLADVLNVPELAEMIAGNDLGLKRTLAHVNRRLFYQFEGQRSIAEILNRFADKKRSVYGVCGIVKQKDGQVCQKDLCGLHRFNIYSYRRCLTSKVTKFFNVS